MSWDERVEGASEDLNPLPRQQKGRLAREKQGGESKWKEEKEENTRIELHPVSFTSVCLCLQLTFTISKSKHSRCFCDSNWKEDKWEERISKNILDHLV